MRSCILDMDAAMGGSGEEKRREELAIEVGVLVMEGAIPGVAHVGARFRMASVGTGDGEGTTRAVLDLRPAETPSIAEEIRRGASRIRFRGFPDVTGGR